MQFSSLWLELSINIGNATGKHWLLFSSGAHTMAQLSLLVICSVFLIGPNLISAVSWGNLDDRFEINNKIPNLESNNIQVWEENYITQTPQMNAIIENNNNLFGGIQVEPAYSSENSDSTRYTIMYKLGARIDGKE